jgi:hypothetical protein
MDYRLRVKTYRDVGKPALDRMRRAADAGGRHVYRLSRHWAIAVNWKIIGAIGLASLVWALIAAVLVSV